jgi:hypothetical protein
VRLDHVGRFIENATHGVPIRLANVARFFQTLRITKMITPQLRNSINDSSLGAFLLIPFVLASFALSPQARAVCQEGCDAVNFNTFLGEDALLDHSGVSNTAVGWHALKNNANTSWNTAIGTAALEDNTSGYDNTAVGVAALEGNTTG